MDFRWMLSDWPQPSEVIVLCNKTFNLESIFVGRANIHKLFAIIQHLLAKLNTFFHVITAFNIDIHSDKVNYRHKFLSKNPENILYLNLRGVNLLDVEDFPLKCFLIYLHREGWEIVGSCTDINMRALEAEHLEDIKRNRSVQIDYIICNCISISCALIKYIIINLSCVLIWNLIKQHSNNIEMIRNNYSRLDNLWIYLQIRDIHCCINLKSLQLWLITVPSRIFNYSWILEG
uniref:Recep_L_domain domain-containing protein n=1 Tax=Heterorhabditis bacteriophora TaxID=37862 RepID=A0A1I7WAE9_HETBA